MALAEPPRIGGTPKIPRSGTIPANIGLDLGCASKPSRKPIFAHGGARLFGSRRTEHLTLAQGEKLLKASEIASAVALPLNRFTTVHWEAAGVADREAMKATTAYLKYLREWLRGDTAYVWSRENGGGKGSHLHILWHLPAGRQLHGGLPRRWTSRIAGKSYRRGCVVTRSIHGWRAPESNLYLANLGSTLSYLLKGIEPNAATALGIEHEPGGIVIGKRCGTSRNLARREL